MPDKKNAEKCEICHRAYDKKYSDMLVADVIFDGVLTRMCKNCMETHDAVIVAKPTERQIADIYKPSALKRKEEIRKETELFDFGKMMQKAREKARLKQKELAFAINEPVETIKDIENGIINDSEAVSKLKQFLRINLQQGQSQEVQDKISEESEQLTHPDLKEATIGDLRKLHEKREQAKKQMRKQLQARELLEQVQEDGNNNQ